MSSDPIPSIQLRHVGAKAALAAVHIVHVIPNVRELGLSANGLNNNHIVRLLEELKGHPSLTSLDLSHNPISVVAGQALLRFVAENHRVRTVNVTGTSLLTHQVEALAEALQKNARPPPSPNAVTPEDQDSPLLNDSMMWDYSH